MKRILVVVFATLALALGLSGPASGAADQHASCQALVNSGFAGTPGGRALELQDAFEEAAEQGVPVGAVLSEFSRLHGGSVEGCFQQQRPAQITPRSLAAVGLREQAMSQENVEIVRQLYDAIDRGDADAVLALYDPEIEWHFARSPFRNLVRHDVYRGREALREFVRERYEDAWVSVTDQVEELIDADEYVVSVIKTSGRGRVSGAPAEKTHAGVWTIRDGKVLRVDWMTREEALEAAELRRCLRCERPTVNLQNEGHRFETCRARCSALQTVRGIPSASGPGRDPGDGRSIWRPRA